MATTLRRRATKTARTIALEHEKDRARFERRGVREATKLSIRMLKTTQAAITKNVDIITALTPVLDQFATLLREGMLAADLAGRVRAMDGIDQQISKRATKAFAFATIHEEAVRFMARRLKLGDADLEELRARYGDSAAEISIGMGSASSAQVSQMIADSVAEGIHPVAAARQARRKLAEKGLDPGSAHRMETVFRTQTLQAYSGARWKQYQDPDVASFLWGFEYATVGDDRVRPEHFLLDGVRAAKDDPVWSTAWPPNGWNCRCTTIEIFDGDPRASDNNNPPKSDDVDGVPTDPVPDEGFSFNPGDLLSDVRSRVPGAVAAVVATRVGVELPPDQIRTADDIRNLPGWEVVDVVDPLTGDLVRKFVSPSGVLYDTIKGVRVSLGGPAIPTTKRLRAKKKGKVTKKGAKKRTTKKKKKVTKIDPVTAKRAELATVRADLSACESEIIVMRNRSEILQFEQRNLARRIERLKEGRNVSPGWTAEAQIKHVAALLKANTEEQRPLFLKINQAGPRCEQLKQRVSALQQEIGLLLRSRDKGLPSRSTGSEVPFRGTAPPAFKDKKEGVQWIRDFLADEVSLPGVTVETTQEIADGWRAVVPDDHPKLKKLRITRSESYGGLYTRPGERFGQTFDPVTKRGKGDLAIARKITKKTQEDVERDLFYFEEGKRRRIAQLEKRIADNQSPPLRKRWEREIEIEKLTTRWSSSNGRRGAFSTMAHETGHEFYYTAYDPVRGKSLKAIWEDEWRSLKMEDRVGISQYGATNSQEGFAEITAMLATGRGDQINKEALDRYRRATKNASTTATR